MGFQVHGITVALKHHDVIVIQIGHLYSFTFHEIKSNASSPRFFGNTPLIVRDNRWIKTHDFVSRVRHQNVLFTIFRVGQHVNGSIPGTQFRDGPAFHMISVGK